MHLSSDGKNTFEIKARLPLNISPSNETTIPNEPMSMVENSLGRFWVEGHPDDNLKANWKYYLEEVEQEPEVQVQLAKIRENYATIKPEEILCIENCTTSLIRIAAA